jgi:hypothetical protein
VDSQEDKAEEYCVPLILRDASTCPVKDLSDDERDDSQDTEHGSPPAPPLKAAVI